MATVSYPLSNDFKVTSKFGDGRDKTSEGYYTRKHMGIDLVLVDKSKDDTIYATESGKIQYAGNSGGGDGNHIWIKHDNGGCSVYSHLAKFLVKAGDTVRAKQAIGVMGNTGKSTGKHLHFGVASNDTCNYNTAKFYDPMYYFNLSYAQVNQGATIPVRQGSIAISSTKYVNEQKNTVESTTSGKSQQIAQSIIKSGEYYQVTDLKGTTSDWLYGRRYRVFIQLSDGNTFDVSELRCVFEITKSAYYQQSKSIVSIYNLNPDDENKLIQEGQKIIIEAGYEGSQYGKIYQGTIIQPIRSKENGVDYKLTLLSMDSDKYVVYGLVGVSLVAGQSARDAISNLVSKAGDLTNLNYNQKEGVISDVFSSIKYPRGKVLFGNPTSYLNQLAVSGNTTYYNDDEEVCLISAKDLADDEVFDLSPESGLLNTPEQTQNGIKVVSLLNPRFKINSLFHIDNKRITNYEYSVGRPVRSLDTNGIYRVVKIVHSGDTRGEDWKTEIEAITQAGLLPGMLIGSDIYGW